MNSAGHHSMMEKPTGGGGMYLEYVTGNGCYIDTGVTSVLGLRYEMEARWTVANGQVQVGQMGDDRTDRRDQRLLVGSAWDVGGGSTRIGSNSYVGGSFNTYDMGNAFFTVNGVTSTGTVTTGSVAPRTVKIFGDPGGYNFSQYSKGDVKYLKLSILESGSWRYLIDLRAYMDANGVACLRDELTGNLIYKPANSPGELIAGPVLT